VVIGSAVSRPLRLALVAVLLVGLAPSVARADITSWLYVGGGPAFLGEEVGGRSRYALLQLETGVGSSPANAVILGGLFRTVTFFSGGTDLSLVARGASGGFARGGFGFAIDAGGYLRNWGDGSAGFMGSLVLGGPFGVQLSGLTELGSHDNKVYGVLLGIDFLRLTVYRTANQSYWPNPILPTGVTR
jgi:hypothetical protein